LTLQSRQAVPADLYKIFSNEELKMSEKDGEKKVRTHFLIHVSEGTRYNPAGV
jgi:hypothetical protein